MSGVGGGRDGPKQVILDAAEGSLVPLGTYNTRPDGDGFVTTLPMVAANALDVDQDTQWDVHLDIEEDAVVLVKNE